MGKITLLPEQIINRIAAGEVVERPVSVVKELVENSIDAAASSISVTLVNGGKSQIVVRDDGEGMDQDDIFLALERHATSKLVDIGDLRSIHTLGFRGEAIPSIAAVARLKISSARSHGEGYFVEYADGKLSKHGGASLAKGTEISVSNLFFTIPVRRKFLKSNEREFALVKELMQKMAVQYPEITFSLTHNQRRIFNYKTEKTRTARLLSVWNVAEHSVAVLEETSDIGHITVGVGTPFATFSGPSIVTVNGRIINDRRLNGVVYRTFRETVGGAFSAPFALFLELDPQTVDVNVHPAKLEVRFSEERALFAHIERLLKQALSSFRDSDSVFEKGSHSPLTSKTNTGTDTATRFHRTTTDTNAVFPEFLKEQEPNLINRPVPTVPQQDEFAIHFSNYKVHGTAFGLYLLVEMNDNLYLIDQHASHERITFNKMKEITARQSGLSQMFITPEPIQLSPEELIILREQHALFSQLGFVIEPFDESSALLRGVPALEMQTEWVPLIKEMLGELKHNGETSAFDEQFLGFIATKACHASVRHNDTLSPQQIEALLSDINNSQELTCPHGRPFFFKISRQDIEKQVERR